MKIGIPRRPRGLIARGLAGLVVASIGIGSLVLAASDYVSWTDAAVTFKVPTAAARRPYVSVTTIGGKSNAVLFWVTPTVTAFGPVAATPGTLITIYGSGFGAYDSAKCLVYFGNVKATQYTKWNPDKICVKVPKMGRGKVVLTVKTIGGVSAGNNNYFTVK